MDAGAVTRKIKKQLRANDMGDLTVRTTFRANNVWSTVVFTGSTRFTNLDVLFAFQGWQFPCVEEFERFVVFVSPAEGL